MKKTVALLILTCMIFALIPFSTAFAEMTVVINEDFSGELEDWQLADKISVQSYNGSNMLFLNGTANASQVMLAKCGKNWGDIIYESDFALIKNGHFGWMFRQTEAGNYLLQYYPSGELKLLKQISTSAYTEIASKFVSIALKEIYHMKIEAIGNNITVYLDKEELFTAKDTGINGGCIGIRVLNCDVYIDNVLVQTDGLDADGNSSIQEVDCDFPAITGTTTKEMYEQRVSEQPLEYEIKKPVKIDGGTKIFVSPLGSDKTGLGTIDSPYLTLNFALKKAKEGNTEDTVVYMRGGNYPISETIKIDDSLKGIKISAYNKETVKLTGGYAIPGEKFIPVTDPEILERFYPAVRDKVRVVDLPSVGITDFGVIKAGGFDMGADTTLPIDVFFGDDKMTLSRWPNDSNTIVGNVIDAGNAPSFESKVGEKYFNDGRGFEFELADDRPLAWKDTDNIWMYGAYSREWALARIKVKEIKPETKSVRTVHASPYGAVTGCEFYFLNILEEIDMPGEYFIDNKNGKLYIIPFGTLEDNTINWSFSSTDVIYLSNAKDVVISGIDIESCKGNAINGRGVNDCTLQGLRINNVGGYGIYLEQTFNTTILTCDIVNITKGGIAIQGNSNVLTKNGNYVQNNYLTNIGKDNDCTGIVLRGTGNVVSHNSIHVLDISAIRFDGFENIIEYNEIGDCMKKVDDGGAIYTFSNFLVRGNHLRYNYLHDIYGTDKNMGGGVAIYLDYLTTDNLIYGNTIINATSPIHHTWGREVAVVDNIIASYGRSHMAMGSILDGKVSGLNYFDSPDQAKYRPFNDAGEPNGTFKTSVAPIPWLSRPWIARYPRLSKTGTDEWWIPKHCYYANNVIYDHLPISLVEERITYGEVVNNDVLKESPFVDYEGGDYTLRKDASVINEYEGFVVPPSFKESGITVDGILRDEKPAISKFYLTYPEKYSSGVDSTDVTLRWTPALSADYYDVEIATDSEMKNIVLSERVEINTLKIALDEYGKKYYWRVTANTRMNSIDRTPVASEISVFTTKSEEVKFEEVALSAKIMLDKYSAPDSGYNYSKEVQNTLLSAIEKARENAKPGKYVESLLELQDAMRKFLRNAEKVCIVDDTFENETLGKQPEGYAFDGRGRFVVDQTDEGNVLTIIDEKTDGYAVLPKTFDSVTGKFAATFRIKPMQTNCIMYVKMRQDTITDPVVIVLGNDGSIGLTSSLASTIEKIGKYEAGKWLDFSVEVDMAELTYSISINGVPYFKDEVFDDRYIEVFEEKNYFNSFFITTGSPLENMGKFYFDDLKIYATHMANEKKAFETVNAEASEELWQKTLADMGDQLVFSLNSPKAISKRSIKYIDQNIEVSPYIKNERTLIPIRFISENMGLDVQWDEESKTVLISNENKEVKMSIGNKTYFVDGVEKTMDAAPEISSDRTFVPIRAVAESLDMMVDYDKHGLISISKMENALSKISKMSLLTIISRIQ